MNSHDEIKSSILTIQGNKEVLKGHHQSHYHEARKFVSSSLKKFKLRNQITGIF
jgi:hypothetical protein